jgi:hypothetical protein
MTYVAEVEPAVAPETRRGTLSNGLSASGGARLLAPPAGARIQTSRSSSVVKITGIALGWIGLTTASGEVVRKPYTLCGLGIRTMLECDSI